ncbi:MAG: HAMP domain-containing histidine kinase [Sulfurovum sp.]|nr:HAMP domain-containing histidine kinase [Sulfurovum sp.]
MKHVSVSTFIHTLFLLVFSVLLATFYFFYTTTEVNRKPENVARYKPVSDSFLFRENLEMTEKQLKQFYDDYKIEPIDTKKALKEIEKRGETIFESQTMYGRFRVFKTEDQHYIYVQRLGYTQMFVDNQSSYYDQTYALMLSIGSAMLALFILMYIMILKKLYPLKRLHKQIEQFADGNLDIKIDNQGGDEIGKIAQSFDKAIAHIRQLISSKNLFMRNIMHELKTPITKGRIVSETIDDPMAKKVLVRAFERMNELISDLADVERITMYNFEPTKEHIMLSNAITRTEKVLMADKDKYTIKVSDRALYTDKKLLALSLKNLMDNGIKYGIDKHVKVISVGNRIEVSSKGEPLKEEFSFYIEPFSQDEKRSHGFGLGLYIVNNVLEKLGYGFRYHYDKKAGENIFSITMNE